MTTTIPSEQEPRASKAASTRIATTMAVAGLAGPDTLRRAPLTLSLPQPAHPSLDELVDGSSGGALGKGGRCPGAGAVVRLSLILAGSFLLLATVALAVQHIAALAPAPAPASKPDTDVIAKASALLLSSPLAQQSTAAPAPAPILLVVTPEDGEVTSLTTAFPWDAAYREIVEATRARQRPPEIQVDKQQSAPDEGDGSVNNNSSARRVAKHLLGRGRGGAGEGEGPRGGGGRGGWQEDATAALLEALSTPWDLADKRESYCKVASEQVPDLGRVEEVTLPETKTLGSLQGLELHDVGSGEQRRDHVENRAQQQTQGGEEGNFRTEEQEELLEEHGQAHTEREMKPDEQDHTQAGQKERRDGEEQNNMTWVGDQGQPHEGEQQLTPPGNQEEKDSDEQVRKRDQEIGLGQKQEEAPSRKQKLEREYEKAAEKKGSWKSRSDGNRVPCHSPQVSPPSQPPLVPAADSQVEVGQPFPVTQTPSWFPPPGYLPWSYPWIPSPPPGDVRWPSSMWIQPRAVAPLPDYFNWPSAWIPYSNRRFPIHPGGLTNNNNAV